MLTDEDREKLIANYLPLVRRIAYGQRKVRDKDAALSAAQHALIRAARAWHGAGSFEGYLRKAVYNALVDEIKEEIEQKHAPLIEDRNGETILEPDQHPREALPRIRPPRKRYHGGDSVVLRAVIRREVDAAMEKGNLRRALRCVGYSEEEIEVELWKERRRLQQQTRRQRERAARQQFETMFPA
jgi:hypothetical protein